MAQKNLQNLVFSSTLQDCTTENVKNFNITYTDFELSRQNIETEEISFSKI